MRRILVVMFLSLILLMALAGSAGAANPQPAEQAPIEGTHAHQHFVLTGNGGCVDIDQVLFEPGPRGLHRAANETGPDKGPQHIFPGLGCEDLE